MMIDYFSRVILSITCCLIFFSIQVESRVSYSSKNNNPLVKEYCNNTKGETYTCSIGHCCKENNCCPYFYELWWFWLIWITIVILIGCCLYHHRQKRYQRSRELRAERRRNKESYEGVCNYPGPPLEKKVLGNCRLPGYKDVIRIPPSSSPPPPYSARRPPIHEIACLHANDKGETTMSIIHCNITSSMLSLASMSHYVPELLAKNKIKPITKQSGLYKDDNNNNQLNCVDETRSNVCLDRSMSFQSICSDTSFNQFETSVVCHNKTGKISDPNNNDPCTTRNPFEIRPDYDDASARHLLCHVNDNSDSVVLDNEIGSAVSL